MHKILLSYFSLLLFTHSLHANIILPALFSDHMVLQQNSEVTFWGWAKPNENIQITASWDTTAKYTLQVNNQSAWNIKIKTPKAGGPYHMKIVGHNTILIKDILIGEVWLGSGQSNMEWTANLGINNKDEEIANAKFPEIRFFTVGVMAASTPQVHLTGKWEVCSPATMQNFSALMYFFGRELYQNIKKPIGLINASWGGTPVEIWMSDHATASDRRLKDNATLLKPVPWGPIEPGVAFNSMIYPIAPFKIKGALWYQGESNIINAHHYARSLATLIHEWRALWGYEFPFYLTQIAPFGGYGTDNVSGAIVRDQQRKLLNMTTGTGLAVLSDIGDLKDIHPGNKQDVGKRLAAWALNHDYNYTSIVPSGPLYASHKIEADKLSILFEYGKGLIPKGGDLKELEVLNSENRWVPIHGKINGETIEINSKEINSIKGVRYAYKNDSTPNLFNAAGLPASCFEILF